MMFDLPDHHTLYDALCARDDRYDGRAWVGVSSTGIFCRLTCPARNPKPENCQFFPSISACIEAGFRPCKRCRPLAPAAAAEPVIQMLLNALEADPSYRFREEDIAAMGLDPSTVRRAFKRHYGMTFLEMARQRRLRDGFTTLANGGPVIDAQLDAGFESASAFRTAFGKLMGQSPGSFAKDALLRADWIDTPLGAMVTVCDARTVHLLEFIDRKALPRSLKKLQSYAKGSLGFGSFDVTAQLKAELAAFFAGQNAAFSVPLAYHGSAFTQQVWRALREIPAGETRSYSDMAQAINRPTAMRAVARANGANQIALIIPCHRVIGADGSLTGYGGGLWRKQRLIELEQNYRTTSPR
ncbi:trifunctional transcriptional activator/DNA repair protein Ada/methylated-DNA--[protein]-cysteine S-methyltransferase [Cognatishimia sp. SS12]|uniref:bifunctional transcriptional activator/DNA repair enzyme AdaA n=1 Tax=Cognatishimia sp. SS12 TaxID=2979465 RepID=UPI00232DB915|nr:trifunctional transcriptional activator/DNA repair protein Ada/methylated-DNA--[protein]-cysteine S-methyltransferase [Cognatishimia sp. SS12]MDC0737877.1 trifunctional transcriptional activator/DNA repair protein Ada/methylated-DNA--[protein]-cysteine S-methyltransferase [Cognatishimia sp. SS12]